MPVFNRYDLPNLITPPRVTVDYLKEDIESFVLDDKALSVVLKPSAGYSLTSPGTVSKEDTENRDLYWKTDELKAQLVKRKEVYKQRRRAAIGSELWDNVMTFGRYIQAMDALLMDLELDEVETP